MSSIQTNRLSLRPLQEDQIEPLAELLLHEKVSKYLPFVPENVEMDTAVEALHKKLTDDAVDLWVLETLATKKHIGVVELYNINKQHRRGHIGYFLNPQYWNRGYGKEAVKGVCTYAFETNFQRLQAEVVVGNIASMNLLESIGFKEEGMLRSHVTKGTNRKDVYVYGLLQGELHD